jgi:hypothetical protein
VSIQQKMLCNANEDIEKQRENDYAGQVHHDFFLFAIMFPSQAS